MSRLLQALFGRLPIGWLQLTHSRTRFAAALAGVAFANVLVLVQLGIMNSMALATQTPYKFFSADIMISASDSNALNEGGHVARQWMLQAMADPQVTAGMGLLMANVSWKRLPVNLSLSTFGVDLAQPGFLAPDLAAKARPLQVQMSGLVDRLSRGLPRDEAAAIRPQSPVSFESSGQTLTLYDSFAGGAGFGGDGFMIVSDQTFLSLFPARSSAAPNHILLKTAPGADPAVVAARLRDQITDKTLKIRSYAQAAQDELTYQQTKRPTGLIFGFGVLIGVLVGLVIVYQVLSTDVADHLREYATFKAMGYGPGFFLGVVFEEALILGVIGFLPGLILGTGMLIFLGHMTALPIHMTTGMALSVFLGTIVFSTISGAIATRRLAAADPADLF